MVAPRRQAGAPRPRPRWRRRVRAEVLDQRGDRGRPRRSIADVADRSRLSGPAGAHRARRGEDSARRRIGQAVQRDVEHGGAGEVVGRDRAELGRRRAVGEHRALAPLVDEHDDAAGAAVALERGRRRRRPRAGPGACADSVGADPPDEARRRPAPATAAATLAPLPPRDRRTMAALSVPAPAARRPDDDVLEQVADHGDEDAGSALGSHGAEHATARSGATADTLPPEYAMPPEYAVRVWPASRTRHPATTATAAVAGCRAHAAVSRTRPRVCSSHSGCEPRRCRSLPWPRARRGRCPR